MPGKVGNSMFSLFDDLTTNLSSRDSTIQTRHSLHAGHIRSCDMSREEETEMHDRARSSVPILHSTALGCSQSWKLLRNTRGVALYEDYTKHSNEYTIKSHCKIKASIEEIMYVMDCPSSTTYRSFMKLTYKNYFKDSSVMYHNRLNSQETLSLRWCSFKCPNPLMLDQDFCLLEYASNDNSSYGYLVNNNQEDNEDNDLLESVSLSPPLAVRYFQSVSIKHCPSLEETHKLERGDMPFLGFLLWPTKVDEETKVIFIASIKQETCSSSRNRANRYLLQALAHSLGRLQNAIDASRLGKKLLTRNLTWVNDGERSECFICFRRFNHIRRKHHCRVCGEIICKACSLHKDIDLPSVGISTLRMCKKCEEIGSRKTIMKSNTLDQGHLCIQQRRRTNHKLRTKYYIPLSPTSEVLSPLSLSSPFPTLSPLEAAASAAVTAATQNSISANELNYTLKGVEYSSKGLEYSAKGLAYTTKGLQYTAKGLEYANRSHNTRMANIIKKEKEIGKGKEEKEGKEGKEEIEMPLDDIIEALCDLALESLECSFSSVVLTMPKLRYIRKLKGKSLETLEGFSYCDYILEHQKALLISNLKLDSRSSLVFQHEWCPSPERSSPSIKQEFQQDIEEEEEEERESGEEERENEEQKRDKRTRNKFFQKESFTVNSPYSFNFYAGAPLLDSEGKCFGAVCVMDKKEKSNVEQHKIKVMRNLAQLASLSIEQRTEKYKRTLVAPNQEETDEDFYYKNQMLQMLNTANETQKQLNASRIKLNY